MSTPAFSPLPPGEGQGEGLPLLIDNFAAIAAAPGGIKKLRELILDLAVRGRLVPQDPTDEPASKLVERIQSEKSNFQKGGRTKKNVHFAKVMAEDEPFLLPFGWTVARLGELFEIEDSLREPVNKAARDSRAGPYPYYGANGQVGFIDDFRFDGLRILVAEDGGFFDDPIRGVAYIAEGKYWVNNHAHVLRPLGSSNPRFWVAFFNRLNWKPLVRGATRDKLNQAAMIQIPMVDPPLAEQHRIVTKVDELMALCDRLESGQMDSERAHQQLVTELLATLTQSATPDDFAASWQRLSQHFDTLFNTEASIDALKQTILQLAVMGKLVPQDPKDEPARVLLNRIQALKEKLVKEGAIRKEKPLAPVATAEVPFLLPESWAWVRLGVLAELVTSGSRDWAQYYADSGAKFVRMGNLSRGTYQLRMQGMQHVRPPAEGEGNRTRLEEGDLLISITGEVGWLGRIPAGFGEAYINQHVCLVRFVDLIRNRYFAEVLRSPFAYQHYEAPQRGIKNSFRLSDVTEMPIPVPPLAEQIRIVEKVDEMLGMCEELRAGLVEARETQEQLAITLVEQAVT